MVIRLGIIGYGGMGSYHGRRLKNNPSYKIVSSLDIDPKRRELSNSVGIKAYDNENDFFASDINAVLIATPNDVHPHYATMAASHKKHILCEKPVSIDSDSFRHMEREAQANGVLLTVNQNRRWDKDYLTAVKIINSGILGKVYRIESRVMGANGIPGGWRKMTKHGGGMMLDWGVHLIDQLCYFDKSSVNFIRADYSFIQGHEVEDGFNLELGFESGLNANIVVDTNTFIQQPRWIIYGTLGTACINDWDCNGEIIIKKDSDAKIVGIQAGNGFTKTMAARPNDAVSVFDIPNVEVDAERLYNNFCLATFGKEDVEVKTSEVMRVLIIMEKAKQSASSKLAITEKV